jgi:hypothetical protein
MVFYYKKAAAGLNLNVPVCASDLFSVIGLRTNGQSILPNYRSEPRSLMTNFLLYGMKRVG